MYFKTIYIVVYWKHLRGNGYHKEEMDMATQVQTLDKAVFISHNTIQKGMNPTILPSTKGK